jgi:predicted amidohydrolase YtcJ
MLDTDIMNCADSLILKTNVLQTFSNGQQVYRK